MPMWSSDICPDFYEEGKLFFTNFQEETEAYQLGKDGNVIRLTKNIPGRLVTALESGELILQQKNKAGEQVYRITSADGTPLSSEEYEEFRYLGCGFMNIRHQGTWYAIGRNGKLSKDLRFPVSC